jgi:hypothetical protein
MEAIGSSETSVFTEPYGETSKTTAFFELVNLQSVTPVEKQGMSARLSHYLMRLPHIEEYQ